MSSNPRRTQPARLRRLAASFGVLAVGAALAFGSAVPASAAPNIDPAAVGSITVHKFQEPVTPTGAAHDGSEVDTSGLTAIDGITFTAEQVNIDLTDSSQWQGLESYTVPQAQSNLGGVSKTAVTGADGVTGEAKFEDLPVGLYLLTETNTGSNGISFEGVPFLVTIPLALGNDWNYNVHVYPKDTVSTLAKTVDDSAAHVIGDPIVFALMGQVPSLPAEEELKAYGITDTLDERLSYQNATVAVADVALVPADYVIASTPTFSVKFTAPGLAKLKLAQGKAVTVTVNTTINALGSGTITNQAQVFINTPENVFNSNTVTTSWGAMKVLKHAKGEQSKVLSGAVFEIYALDGSDVRIPGALKNVSGTGTTFTTLQDGTFQVNGLKAGNYELVETKAPLGFKLDSTPRKVTIEAGNLADATVTSVENEQVPAFQLPLTGSTGISLFIGGGLVLIVGGVLLAVIRKRRAQRA